VQQAWGGVPGHLKSFSLDFSMQVREDNIRLKRAKGGGPLYDIGIYASTRRERRLERSRSMSSQQPPAAAIGGFEKSRKQWLPQCDLKMTGGLRAGHRPRDLGRLSDLSHAYESCERMAAPPEFSYYRSSATAD
jgi:hypothetical protein